MSPQGGIYEHSCSDTTDNLLFIQSQPVNRFKVASVTNRRGYMELGSVCLLREGALVQGRVSDVLYVF